MKASAPPTLDFGFTTPDMPVLDLSRCYTRPVNHLTASRMMETFHYAHLLPPSVVLAVGMYVDDVLAGCVTYGTSSNANVHRCCGDEFQARSLELNRLFIHDWAGRNSESWLIAQSFRWLADRCPESCLLISYADPSRSHLGSIYQATNWIYTGKSEGGGAELTVNGTPLHQMTVSKTYGTRDCEKLRAMGLEVTRASVISKHRYVTFLGDRRLKRTLRAALRWPVLPYPKDGSL